MLNHFSHQHQWLPCAESIVGVCGACRKLQCHPHFKPGYHWQQAGWGDTINTYTETIRLNQDLPGQTGRVVTLVWKDLWTLSLPVLQRILRGTEQSAGSHRTATLINAEELSTYVAAILTYAIGYWCGQKLWEGTRASRLPVCFLQRQQYDVWIREWPCTQSGLSFTCRWTLDKLFTDSELQFLRPKSESIHLLKWLLWWFLVMTCEKDYSTQHTFLLCFENLECHLMHRESRVTKKLSNKCSLF